MSTADELALCKRVAETSGIILDPVYSGKALYGLLQDMKSAPETWRGRRVLFWHTGGMLGMFDKLDQLTPLVEVAARFDVGGLEPLKPR